MFKNMLVRIRQVMYRMGLIKGIKKLADHKDIQINEDFYKYIGNWKALYKGYFSEWHDIRYTTIAGQKKRRMASLNMPKVVSQELATLIFNEQFARSIFLTRLYPKTYMMSLRIIISLRNSRIT